MATRKITFTLPEEVARQFLRRVPSRERSKYLAEALREKLSAHDGLLIQACRVANNDPKVRAIEEEFDAFLLDSATCWNCD
jgi:hypothetical protein